MSYHELACNTTKTINWNCYFSTNRSKFQQLHFFKPRVIPCQNGRIMSKQEHQKKCKVVKRIIYYYVDFMIIMIKHVGQTKHCKAAKDTLSLQKMFLGGHDRKNLKM
jgi:hypothetical protein